MGKVMHGDKTRAGASRLYSIWCDMKRRCIDPSRRNYKHYGGKGVRVCGEWLSYTAFKAWALSSGYKDNLTCGWINESLSLKDREWTCQCGQIVNRDHNAAQNILRFGKLSVARDTSELKRPGRPRAVRRVAELGIPRL